MNRLRYPSTTDLLLAVLLICLTSGGGANASPHPPLPPMSAPPASVSAPASPQASLRVVSVLPTQDLYVDHAHPTESFAGRPLEVSSSSAGKTEKLAFLLFDLAVIPPGSTVSAAQLVAAAPAPGQVPQQVRVTHLDDNAWPATMTWEYAASHHLTNVGSQRCVPGVPAPCLAGEWLMPGGSGPATVFTNEANPSLVDRVQAALPPAGAAAGGRLTLQLSSSSAQGVEVAYASSASAAGSTPPAYALAPRLLVRYTPPPTLLGRDWGQWQADARHTGRTRWKFAQSPVPEAVSAQTFSTSGGPKPPVIHRGQLYFFSASSSGNRLHRMAPNGRAHALPTTLGTGAVATALGPPGYLYAADSSSLILVDLSTGAPVGGPVELDDFTGTLTAGPAGGVYLVESPGANSFRVSAFALLGGSSPSLVRSWQFPPQSAPALSAPATAVTLSADASLAYVATDSAFHALCNASVSAPAGCANVSACVAIGQPLWSHSGTWSSVQTPVAADDGQSTVYLAADRGLYGFQCTETPLQNTPIKTSSAFAQPVMTADNVLIAPLSGAFYAVRTRQGSVYQAASSCQPSGAGCRSPTRVSNSDLTVKAGTLPVLDGNDHLYYVDSSNQAAAFVYSTGPSGPSLTKVFRGVTVTAPSHSSLVLGPSGTVYTAVSTGILALEPKVAPEVTVSGWATDTAYRAAEKLILSSEPMPATSSILLQSGGSICYPKPAGAFTIPVGTQVFNLPGCCQSPPSSSKCP